VWREGGGITLLVDIVQGCQFFLLGKKKLGSEIVVSIAGHAFIPTFRRLNGAGWLADCLFNFNYNSWTQNA